MCASCQADLVHKVSQNVARRDGFNLLDEEHNAISCTRLWTKRHKYIHDKADGPSTASFARSDYLRDKPWEEIRRHILLGEVMLERK